MGAGASTDVSNVTAVAKQCEAASEEAVTDALTGLSAGALAKLSTAVQNKLLSPGADDEPEPEGEDEDGVLLAAKSAAKKILALPPPDSAHPDDRKAAAAYVEKYIFGGFDGKPEHYGDSPWDDDDEKDRPAWANRISALRWVRGALGKVAAGERAYKRPVLYAITNNRMWPDHQDAGEIGFKQLKSFCEAKLDVISIETEYDVYDANELGDKLSDLCNDIKKSEVNPRQDESAGFKSCRGRRPRALEIETSEHYILELLLAAYTLDKGFHAKAAAAYKEAGGTTMLQPPAVKGVMRMKAKLDTDHSTAKEPKAAENLDVNRVAWVLDDAEQLIKAEAAARAAFGSPIRVKNNYHKDFDALKETKGYRAMLCNYLYDSGKTWGELSDELKTSTNQVFKTVYKTMIAFGAPEYEAASYERDLKEIAESFDKGKKAMLVVEIQFMLRDYYLMRKRTHAWYKVVRAAHANGMALDYSGGLDGDA